MPPDDEGFHAAVFRQRRDLVLVEVIEDRVHLLEHGLAGLVAGIGFEGALVAPHSQLLEGDPDLLEQPVKVQELGAGTGQLEAAGRMERDIGAGRGEQVASCAAGSQVAVGLLSALAKADQRAAQSLSLGGANGGVAEVEHQRADLLILRGLPDRVAELPERGAGRGAEERHRAALLRNRALDADLEEVLCDSGLVVSGEAAEGDGRDDEGQQEGVFSAQKGAHGNSRGMVRLVSEASPPF